MNGKVILAISPGTREFGVTIFNNESLIYYAVKTTGRKRSQRGARKLCQDVDRIVTRLIERFQPDVCALRQLHYIYQQTKLLKKVYQQIQRSVKEEDIKCSEFSATFVRQWICPKRRATKRALAEELTRRYPELSRYAAKSTPFAREYYALLFDAIAVGLVCRETAFPDKINQ